MTNKLSLRLKLSDFINSEFESEIMEKINNIHNELRIAVMLYLWFDIVPSGTSYNSRKRFQFGYTKKEHILRGLDDFYNVAKFTTSEKPVKKQKRNDYED